MQLQTSYANSVSFEFSAWDLKLVFGQLDQQSEKPLIERHTAVTIPWAVAKTLSYWLLANIAIYERNNGAIRVPPVVVPPRPEPSAGDSGDAVYRAMLEAHERLFGENAGEALKSRKEYHNGNIQ
jgi:hypothetical protein